MRHNSSGAPAFDRASRESRRTVTTETRDRQPWAERRDILLTIIGWFAVAFIAFWLLRFIQHAVLLTILAVMLAFALVRVVRFCERFMPRLVAILLVYAATFVALCGIIYFVADAAARQLGSVAHDVRPILTPNSNEPPSSLQSFLQRIGISQDQLARFGQQATAHVERLAGTAVPFATTVLDALLSLAVIVVLSIYFLLDGGRFVRVIESNVPASRRRHAQRVLQTLERVLGGYIRGQLLMATIIAILVGVGMALFRVPDAALLGVLAFLCAFIPILGTWISGATCVLLALTQGWVTAVWVLIYFVAVHILEGDILGPRITGKYVGLHPTIALLAVLTGAELGGIMGALLAAPIAGVAQALIVSFWMEWKERHPEEFSRGEPPAGSNDHAQPTETIARRIRSSQEPGRGLRPIGVGATERSGDGRDAPNPTAP